MRLQNKVVVVTGAGGGMGRVAAELFAREGARVVVTDISAQGGEETARRISDAGGEAHFVQGNVAREEDVQRVMDRAATRYGAIHVLYNNAGVMPDEDSSVTTMTEQSWSTVMDINLKGAALCCKHAIPRMIAAGGGSIVNIASFVALLGCTVPQDVYTMSKGGLIALTKSLAVQFASQGIRANAICPGPIETPLLRQLWTSEEARNLRLSRIPLGRFGTAEDIVYLGLYLASDESSWTTGAVLVADGGITSNYF
ncbi:MAG TPA: SDR family oxidoreductase [Chloroflexota bacterium]|jgi:NAD(P)-dependent dehydrogenase (short-subunit alcohol dehydrogenase family)|nr:SDR family oxidoreductase [Chloroflexota bacterium]